MRSIVSHGSMALAYSTGTCPWILFITYSLIVVPRVVRDVRLAVVYVLPLHVHVLGDS